MNLENRQRPPDSLTQLWLHRQQFCRSLARAGIASLRYDKRASGPHARENIPLLIGKVSMQSVVGELASAIRVLANREGTLHALNPRTFLRRAGPCWPSTMPPSPCQRACRYCGKAWKLRLTCPLPGNCGWPMPRPCSDRSMVTAATGRCQARTCDLLLPAEREPYPQRRGPTALGMSPCWSDGEVERTRDVPGPGNTEYQAARLHLTDCGRSHSQR